MPQEPVQDGKGHAAAAPSEIPEPGWRSILKRIYASYSGKHLSILAAAIAFYGILSIFPALAALVAIYGLFANPAVVQHELNTLGAIMPGEARKLVATYLKSLVTSSNSKLGLSLLISLLIALWSARAGTVTLMTALNITYEEKEKRGTIEFELVGLAITIAAIIFAIVALMLITAVPPAMHFLSISKKLKIIGIIVPWPVLIMLMSTGLAAVYRFAPSRESAKWRWVTWGSVLATILWIIASIGFSLYVEHFGSYDKTFGSLGAVVVLLTWFYISAFAVLIGACANAEMERQTARDTTTGPEMPMGERGAKMADTVARDSDQESAEANRKRARPESARPR